MTLLDKANIRPYVERFGVDLPQTYYNGCTLAEIDLAGLPSRVVIKPASGYDSDGVMLLDGDRELLRGRHVPRAELKAFCRETLAAATRIQGDRLIVEELLQDYDPRYAIPRDFKVFVAGGHAWIIQIIDRNGRGQHLTQSFYTRDWRRLADPFKINIVRGPDIERPPLLPALIRAAERIGRDLGVFMRLDFYLTTRGLVFGEFTPTPAAGTNFTPFADRLLCKLMTRFPSELAAGWTAEHGRRATPLTPIADGWTAAKVWRQRWSLYRQSRRSSRAETPGSSGHHAPA